MVDMNMAQHAYRASAAVIRTAGEMQKTLLDALA
jgi:flagellar hook-associated protein FlgK